MPLGRNLIMKMILIENVVTLQALNAAAVAAVAAAAAAAAAAAFFERQLMKQLL